MRVLPPRTYANDSGARKRLFTPESVSHPAKMHTALCRDLFLRYTLPGQTVLDPFGGVGTSLLGAILPEPRNVWLVELEPKFVAMAQANADQMRKRMLPGLPIGEMRIEQGDSRHLPFESAVECVVSSPPYADGCRSQGSDLHADRAKGMRHSEAAQRSANLFRGGYSSDPTNIGNLPAGDVSAVLGSPPFGEMNSRDAGGTVTQRPNADGVGFEGGREAFVYSEATPGQIGNLPAGDVAAVISSPPYAASNLEALVGMSGTDRGKLPRKERNARPKTAQGYTGVDNRHATDTRNIAHLPAGDVAAVISSPPYSDLASRNRSAEPYSQAMDPEVRQRYGHEQGNRHVDGYGETAGQIGMLPHAVVTSPPYMDQHAIGNDNPTGNGVGRTDGKPRGGWLVKDGYQEPESIALMGTQETYASACLQVYAECFRVVRPGGVLVLVTGNYVRDGAIIDLAADTIKLAVAAGWTPVERWRHEKAGVSFWRRLHHQQGRPIVTHEDVLVFVKQYQGWEFVELPPTTMAPARLETRAQKKLPAMEAFA